MMADFRWLFDPKALNTQLTGNLTHPYCTALYSTVLCCVVLHYTVSHYTVSHYTPSILYCTPLLYRALSRSPALCPHLDLPVCCLSPVIVPVTSPDTASSSHWRPRPSIPHPGASGILSVTRSPCFVSPVLSCRIFSSHPLSHTLLSRHSANLASGGLPLLYEVSTVLYCTVLY